MISTFAEKKAFGLPHSGDLSEVLGGGMCPYPTMHSAALRFRGVNHRGIVSDDFRNYLGGKRTWHATSLRYTGASKSQHRKQRCIQITAPEGTPFNL